MPKNANEWIESFEIFRKYDKEATIDAAEHDEVYGGPDPVLVSEDDVKRLDELGWHESEYGGGFHAFV